MAAMAQMPDNAFDLAICDPPYGIGASSAAFMHSGKRGNALGIVQHFESKEWDRVQPSPEYFSELKRVSCNQIIWGGNHFELGRTPAFVVWDKLNGENAYADCELAWTSFDSAVRKFTYRWAGMLQGNMANKEKRIHPTQKPVALYKWLLTNYAKPGDTILDTHLGSGSSRIAAYDLGFDFYGTELDTDYFNAQEERFNNHVAQGKLFTPEAPIHEQGLLI
jgi:site-specific DNA-methyltransferase (adenine-specific)